MIALNPEFRRNLWLEMTPLRVVLLGALLLLALGAAAAADYASRNWRLGALDALAQAARYAFYLLVVFWGGWQAAAAIVAEARDRTWDAQRMSALSPWMLSWGKLFGVTSLGWCYGLGCVAVYVATQEASRNSLIEAAAMIGTGLLCQSTAMFASLVRSSARAGAKPGNSTLLFIAALGFTILIRSAAEYAELISRIDDGVPRFYGAAIAGHELKAAAVCAFAAIMIGGIYWQTRLALQIETRPWMWLTILAALAALVGGVVNIPNAPAAKGFAICAAFAMLTYCTVLIEPKDIVQFRRALGIGGRFSLNAWFALSPLWLLTLLVFLLTVGAELVAISSGYAVANPRYVSLVGATPSHVLIALALFAIRDLGIVLIFALRQDARRAEIFGLLCWIGLYGPLVLTVSMLLPWQFLSFVVPVGGGGFWFAVVPALVQAIFVAGIVVHRWRRLRIAA